MHQIEQFYDFGVTGAVLQLVLQVLQFYSLKQCQKSRSCSPFSMDDDVAQQMSAANSANAPVPRVHSGQFLVSMRGQKYTEVGFFDHYTIDCRPSKRSLK